MREPTADVIAERLTLQVQDWVRCRMAERKLRQKDFAVMLGTTPQYLSELLHARDLSLRNIARLVLALDGNCRIDLIWVEPPAYA